eukprot:EG_transcript_14926
MAFVLPDEVWEMVSDFAHWGPLARVCHALRHLLQGRHARLRVTDSNLVSVADRLRQCPTLRFLVARFFWSELEQREAGIRAFCAAIAPLLGLQLLRVQAVGKPVQDGGAVALAQLAALPRLGSFALDLTRQCITASGAQAFTTLAAAPHLRRLELNLALNPLGDPGAKAIAALWQSPTLRSLRLDLGRTDVTAEGCRALAQLADSPIEYLWLSLSSNTIRDEGATHLAELRRSPHLRRLKLSLACNQIGDAGAKSLALLADTPRLAELKLQLSFNHIENAGGLALATLRHTVPKVKLRLGCNHISQELYLALLADLDP